MGELLLGCSGWNYGDTSDKGGWVGVFYPDKDTKTLPYYSQFFNTPDNYQFSVKVPETITHRKRLDVKKKCFNRFRRIP
jgi:uncharacterized protein YecE (DUF72 family)